MTHYETYTLGHAARAGVLIAGAMDACPQLELPRIERIDVDIVTLSPLPSLAIVTMFDTANDMVYQPEPIPAGQHGIAAHMRKCFMAPFN